MTHEPDIEAVPTDIDDERAVRALEGRDAEIPPRMALRLLAQRQSRTAIAALAQFAQTPDVASELRVDATRNLGRAPGRNRQDALVRLLRDRDPAVVAAAAESLGLIGDVRALSALEALAPIGNDPVGRKIRWARTLMSYRLGVGSHLITPPAESDLVTAGPQAAQIEWRAAASDLAVKATRDVARDLPTLSLRVEQGLLLTCFGIDLLLVPTEHLLDSDRLRALDQRNAVPAALLRYWEASERWAPSLLLFTHPQREERQAALLALRPGGILVGGGTTSEQDVGRRFRLRAIRSGYFPPVEVDGFFSVDEGFRLERAVSAAAIDRRVRARTPRRAS